MEITVDRDILFPVLDTLLERWRAKRFPYQKKDAIIPQTVIPDELRRNKKALAIFYFYLCIYMRGGIESLQAFNAMLRMRTDHPHLFDPSYVHGHWMTPEEVQPIIKQYVGWDSEAASINWVTNSRRLVDNWGSNPLNLIKDLTTYDEALRRIRNKLTDREFRSDERKYEGFRGFQPKMVSMILYFYDWEGWLTPRFLYPAPADFHNFRLGLNQGAIRVKGLNGRPLRAEEALSAPWRDALMDYLRMRGADPIEVADAIWMFSLVMCGNSPLNTTKEERENGSGMFDIENLPHIMESSSNFSSAAKKKLKETCLRCPLIADCRYSIPSRPYYRKGELRMKPRPRIEMLFPVFDPDTPEQLRAGSGGPEQLSLRLFDPDA